MYFSVVIPLYNKKDYIGRAIASVLEQSFNDYELLIVDDGSTDGGADVVTEFDDPRIHLVKQKNGGCSAARNRGIQEASAEYIAFLDADDIWLPNFLQSIYEMIKVYPQAGVYSTACGLVNSENKQSNVQLAGIPGGSGWRGIVPNYFRCLDGGWSPVWSNCVCVPMTTFRAVGTFNEKLHIGEDIDMWVRIALKFPMAFLNEVHAMYFRNAEGRVSNADNPGEPPLSYAGEVLRVIETGQVNDYDASSMKYFLDKFNYLSAVACLRIGMPRLSRQWIAQIGKTRGNLRLKIWLVIILSYLPASAGKSVVRFRESL